MASDHDEIERTEAPSPRWVAQARELGHWPRSAELVIAITVFSGVLMVYVAGGPLVQSLRDTLRSRLSSIEITARGVETISGMRQDVLRSLLWLIPFLAVPALVAALSNFGQAGLRFRPELILPDVSRFGVTQILERMFSGTSLRASLLELTKFGFLFALLLGLLWFEVSQVSRYSFQDANPQIFGTARIVMSVGIKLAAALVVIGLLDYFLAWWMHQRRMRMSRTELAAELREMEGDPIIRWRRRMRQLDRAFANWEKVVQDCNLVILGRGGVCVALRSSEGRPTVVAKAIGSSAERMKRAASSRGARIMRHDTLARTIYRIGKVGLEIPMDLAAQLEFHKPRCPTRLVSR